MDLDISFKLLASGIGGLLVALYVYRHVSYRPPAPLPPGPTPWPIIGNLMDMPKKDYPWKQYAAMGKKYGDCFSLTVFGQVIVILNSAAAIRNIILPHSASFNSRPFIKFVEMAGWDGPLFPLTSQKKAWLERRRVIDQYFRTSTIQAYQHVQFEKLITVLRHFVEKPTEFRNLSREYNASVILSIVYGYDVKDLDDRFVVLPEQINEFGPSTILPGALMVNTFPILGSLPPWMLGKKFVWKLERGTTLAKQILYEPYEWIKERMNNGTARESLLRTALEEIPKSPDSARAGDVCAEAFGNIYSAASDTTVSTLSTFFLKMVLHPEIQAKAQAELDRVIGRDRLPEFGDRANLPYIHALLMEITRWSVVTPLGLPHTAEEDIVSGGFFFPKGTIILGNAWGILHDENTYPEPEEFKPERFLDSNGRVCDDPLIEFAFGYGPRRCPGRYLADTTAWLFIASLLSIFNIIKAKDENGNDIPVDGKYEPTMMVHHPLPFKCAVLPRDERALEVLARSPRY